MEEEKVPSHQPTFSRKKNNQNNELIVTGKQGKYKLMSKIQEGGSGTIIRAAILDYKIDENDGHQAQEGAP